MNSCLLLLLLVTIPLVTNANVKGFDEAMRKWKTGIKREASENGGLYNPESYGMLDAFKVSCHPSELNLQCFTAADEGTFPEGSTLSCFQMSDDYMYIQATLGLRCDGKSLDGHGMLCHKTTDENDSYDELHMLCNLNPVTS